MDRPVETEASDPLAVSQPPATAATGKRATTAMNGSGDSHAGLGGLVGANGPNLTVVTEAVSNNPAAATAAAPGGGVTAAAATTAGAPLATNNQRKIIAEDPEWNIAPVDKLTHLCVQVIVNNFKEKPILHGIPEKFKNQILDSIAVDVPVSITAPLIPAESTYWKRASLERFGKLCDVSRHGNSWKRLYFERYVAHLLETFVPRSAVRNDDDDEALIEKARERERILRENLKVSGKYVVSLKLEQLLPVGGTPQFPQGEGNANNASRANGGGNAPDLSSMAGAGSVAAAAANAALFTPSTRNPSDPPPNHLDLTAVFENLTELQELDLYYGVKNCGMDFDWAFFGMTVPDATALSKCLRAGGVGSHTLRSLTIRASSIDCEKVRLLASGLLENKTLRYLDLSHNKIGDSGARGLAKLIATARPPLDTLLLVNNKVGPEGATSIGRALAHNNTLQHLDLRLNAAGDVGATAILAGINPLRNHSHRPTAAAATTTGNGNSNGSDGTFPSSSAATGPNGMLASAAAVPVTPRTAFLPSSTPGFSDSGDLAGPASSGLLSLNLSANYINGSPEFVNELTQILRSQQQQQHQQQQQQSVPPTPHTAASAISRLSSLELSCNKLDDIAGRAIYEAIVGLSNGNSSVSAAGPNRRLKKLDLRMTDIASEHLAAIDAVVKENAAAV